VRTQTALDNVTWAALTGRQAGYLHAAANNTGAIRLYEKLGFAVRTPVMFGVYARCEAVQDSVARRALKPSRTVPVTASRLRRTRRRRSTSRIRSSPATTNSR